MMSVRDKDDLSVFRKCRLILFGGGVPKDVVVWNVIVDQRVLVFVLSKMEVALVPKMAFGEIYRRRVISKQ